MRKRKPFLLMLKVSNLLVMPEAAFTGIDIP